MGQRHHRTTRRAVLGLGVGSLLTLAACAAGPGEPTAAVGGVAAGQAVVLPPPTAQGAAAPPVKPPGVDWLVLDGSVARNWHAGVTPNDPLRLTLTRQPGFAGPMKRILMLYPKAGSAFDLGLNTILTDFDVKKIPCVVTVVNWNEDPTRADASMAQAAADQVDLIFANGSESAAYVHDHYRGTIPVVTVESKDPVILGQVADYVHGSGTSIAYTSVSVPISVQMAYLLQLKPKLTNIAALYEKNNVSTVQTQVNPLRAACQQANIRMLDVTVVNESNAAPELQQGIPVAIARMKQNDPGLANSILLVTGSTSVFTAISTVNQAAGKVPVVSMFPDIVIAGNESAAISIGVSFATAAHISASYGAEILSGKAKASELKVGVVTPPDIAISFLKVEQIGLTIPFSFFESASVVYDTKGKLVRSAGGVSSGTS